VRATRTRTNINPTEPATSGASVFGSVTAVSYTWDAEGGLTVYAVSLDASQYINWGTKRGAGGYGIRDNAGAMEAKDSSGTWKVFPSPAVSTANLGGVTMFGSGVTGSGVSNVAIQGGTDITVTVTTNEDDIAFVIDATVSVANVGGVTAFGSGVTGTGVSNVAIQGGTDITVDVTVNEDDIAFIVNSTATGASDPLIVSGQTVIATPPAYSGASNFTAGLGTPESLKDGGTENTLLGAGAGASVTTGDWNVAIGSSALAKNVTSDSNTAIGTLALSKATVGNNTAIGYNAGTSITTGGSNTLVGALAGDAQAGNSELTAIGYSSFSSNDAAGNTGVG
ncbi:hypothetical protein LCGC14_3143440, partial [marine sediment metagenome]